MQNATTSSANTMKAYEVLKIGQNRGTPRLWLEGVKAKLAGFLPGLRYSIRKDDERKMLVLELAEEAQGQRRNTRHRHQLEGNAVHF